MNKYEVTKEDYSNLLGAKFYKNEKGIVTETVRVMSFVNSTTARIWSITKNETRKISFKDLLKDYIMLTPHGVVLFSIVGLPKGMKDVIISLFKYPNDDGIPYCVCRQNIIDLHNAVVKPNSMIVGCCISQETIPDGVDYKAVRACDSLEMFTNVAIYSDDKLDDILKCVHKISKYDEVLETLYNYNIDNLKFEPLKKEARESNTYGGFCRTVKDLLLDNDFMYDFRRCFGIASFPIEFPECTEDAVPVPSDILDFLQKQYGFYFNNAYVFKYDYDLKFNNIDKDFSVISDKNEELYIVTYDKGNNYVEVNDTMSPEEKLQTIINRTTN